MLRSSRGHDRSPRAAGSPPPSSPPGTGAPQRCQRRNRPPSFITPAARAALGAPALIPKRRHSLGGGCGARPSPPLAPPQLSGSGASSVLGAGRGG